MRRGIAEPYKDPIADRLTRWCADRDVSLSALGVMAGMSKGAVTGVCKQLEDGNANVGMGTLGSFATAMRKWDDDHGRESKVSLKWLLFGDEPPNAIRLCDVPGWNEARAEAIDELGADPSLVDAIGVVQTPDPPERIDAVALAKLARAWKDMPRKGGT